MLILASQTLEAEVGDGTNAVMILAASLLENADELLRMVRPHKFAITELFAGYRYDFQGLKPTEVAEGYELAGKKALEILPGRPDSVLFSIKRSKWLLF